MKRRPPLVDAQTIRNIIRTLAAETTGHDAACRCIKCRRLQSWRIEAKRHGIAVDDPQ